MSSPGPDLAPSRRACVSCGREFCEDLARCPDDGTLLTPLVDQPVIGAVLGDRYEITGVIAGGGMGTIFRAKHQLTKRTVAIKMLHPQMVASAGTLKRFQQEAEAASCLNHPNILTVFDFGLSAQGKPYLVMDCLEGKTLASLLEAEGHLPPGRALRIFVQTTAALAHAHQKGIIHRDLKPANIMLVNLDGDPDFVKLVDFGIAKMLSPEDSEGANLTKTGEVFGSPLYMSPEQCLGNPIDPRTDMYALACVMYRTLTGVTPAEGTDLLEIMYKHANVVPGDFASVCPDLNLSAEIEALVFKAMSKKPDERYQSMEELRAALEALPEFKDASPLPSVTARQSAEIPMAARSVMDVTTDSQVVLPSDDDPTIREKPLAAPVSASPPAQAPVGSGAPVSSDAPAESDAPKTTVEPSELLAMARQLAAERLPPVSRIFKQYRWIAIAAFVLMFAGTVMILRSDMDKGRKQVAADNAKSTAAAGADSSADTDDKDPPPGSLSDDFNQHIKKGEAAYARKNYWEAEKNFQQAYNIAENFGQWDPRFSTCLALAAKVYTKQGRFTDASNALGWVLEYRRRRYGLMSPEVAETLMQMSTLAHQEGDERKAEQLLKQAQAILNRASAAKQSQKK